MIPSFQLKLDDITVTLSLILLSWFFFANSPWYYLTPYQNLLRSDVIFMVRKVGQPLLSGGGGGRGLPPPSTLSLSNFRSKLVRSDLKNYFMERWPKDEPTAKNLVWNKSSSHFLEKLENHPPCLDHRKVKFVYNITIKRSRPFKLCNFNFLSFYIFCANFGAKHCLDTW